MPELAADFIINNTPPIEFEAEITPPEHFDCSFEINVTPDISHLATKEELEETAELINNRIDSVEEDVAAKVETITGSPLINVERSGNSVNITSKTYVHEQGISSNVWNIEHNLGKRPSITVVDSADTVISIFRADYINENNIIIKFNAAFTGKAFLN